LETAGVTSPSGWVPAEERPATVVVAAWLTEAGVGTVTETVGTARAGTETVGTETPGADGPDVGRATETAPAG
jgi:hypothetical protein